jgi:endo-1,4-beta-xylanase
MKTRLFYNFLFIISLVTLICGITACSNSGPKEPSLKDAFKGKFLIGAALNTNQVDGKDSASMAVFEKHFNSIVAENCMKSGLMQPSEGEFFFDDADKLVAFGEKNKLFVVGHTLIWHSQAPRWFFTDENGQDVSREVLIERMEKHISTVVGRYKERVHGWDVVNEAFEDDGKWRNSKFYQIIGEEYVEIAFKAAKAADPTAELYYNDYNMFKEGKRNSVVAMVKSLQEKGIKIDGIGMQGHYTLNSPKIEEVEASIKAYSELGVQVMITEFDITVLPFPTPEISADISLYFERKNEFDPYTEGLPEEVMEKQTQMYTDLFNLFLKYHKNISRVTFWGINDLQSWKNNFPVRGRTDYALIFDRENNPKPAVAKIIEAAQLHKK